jgi:FixJ family two-component response regulator
MSLSEQTVYLVDDDPSIRKSMERLIKSFGYSVKSFSSAKDFLGHHRCEGPCCLVLDVRMPDLSGLALQEMMDDSELQMPIVFITGHGDIPTTVQAMKAGAIDFLPKPCEEKKLMEAVREGLRRDQDQRDQQEELREIKSRLACLTPREFEVFTLVISGMLNKQIAGVLGTAEKTIKVHRARVMSKMKVLSLAELVRHAERLGIKPREIE